MPNYNKKWEKKNFWKYKKKRKCGKRIPCITGTNTGDFLAIEKFHQIISITGECMQLHKVWMVNSEKVMAMATAIMITFYIVNYID